MGAKSDWPGAPASEASSPGREQPPDGDADHRPSSHPADAIRDALRRIGQLREFAAYYASARIDAIKASIRDAGIYAALGLIGVLAAGSIVVVAISLLLIGIAGAFAALLGGRVWLGQIITGAIFLAVLAIGAMVGIRVLRRWFHSKMVQKYEERQRQQRERFGQDVGDEAASEHSAGSAH